MSNEWHKVARTPKRSLNDWDITYRPSLAGSAATSPFTIVSTLTPKRRFQIAPFATGRSINFGRRSNAIPLVFPNKLPVEFSERRKFAQQTVQFGPLFIHELWSCEPRLRVQSSICDEPDGRSARSARLDEIHYRCVVVRRVRRDGKPSGVARFPRLGTASSHREELKMARGKYRVLIVGENFVEVTDGTKFQGELSIFKCTRVGIEG